MTRDRKTKTASAHGSANSAQKVRLRHLAYGSISLLLAGGVFAMAYLFISTTHSADELALRHERALVTEALEHSLELEARHQTFVAVNDKTATEVQIDDRIDDEFAHEIARQMWLDFHHDWTLIVDSKNDLILVAAEDEIVPPLAGQEILEATRDLVAKARIGYQAVRRPAADGYKVKYVEKGELAPIYATDVRDVAGKPGLVSAMAIVPESDDLALPDGPPGVIVSVALIEEAFLAEIGDTLLLQDFTYVAGSDHHEASVPVAVHGHKPIGYFEWTSEAPGSKIRNAIGPIAAVLVLMFIAVGVFFARKLAQKSRALEDSESLNRRMASHDLMTGLANRPHFHNAFDRAMANCHETPCAVVAIDLDRFKAVNDTYGHEAGDMVIRQVARRLRTTLSEHALVARTGGDEFMALLRGPVDDNRMRWLCDTVIEAAAQPIPVSGGLAQIGVSIGWATAPKHADTASHLLALADQALYFAKENGRNMGVCIEDLYKNQTPEVVDRRRQGQRTA
ncbi:GGDEF domain-containing protein [Roseibium sp. MMSF_3544]|uniref:GGDEF domain-containing protein n=1 Tax=unclassified Roseibium TaxID=2629323 RepID=UPI00273D1DD0|nr:GGDEF domain-containing protein [Roseibium sp. MMSF_3544]